jgi:hypothetical protein
MRKMNQAFSTWIRWSKRDQLGKILKFPGVYAIAVSDKNLASAPFEWSEEIIYVGMTNSKGGLESRLQQFENTIIGKRGHGGAARVRYKHKDYNLLVSKLFVSVSHIECDVKSNQPSDLRLMGDVPKHEYECFAIFVEKFGRLPEFNDKKRSPKKLKSKLAT